MAFGPRRTAQENVLQADYLRLKNAEGSTMYTEIVPNYRFHRKHNNHKMFQQFLTELTILILYYYWKI